MKGGTDAGDVALDLQPGDELAPGLRVIRKLGEGGMGVVLLVHNESLDRAEAVKLIHPRLFRDRASRERLLNEARAMARVRQINVCEIFRFGEVAGVPFFTMEYIDGPSLEAWFERHGPQLSLDETIGFLTAIDGALQAIHAQGTVHGDITPGNILVAPGFRVVLVDFGLSLAAGGATGGDAMLGTAPYVAPERLEERPSKDRARADVYAAGIIAYRMLAGALPFEGPDAARILVQHRHKAPPDLHEVTEGAVSRDVADAVRALLAKDPATRPTDLQALLRALHEYRGQLGTPAHRILVVDDDPDFRDLVTTCLREELDAEVEEVESAEAALERLGSAAFDLIFVDLNLPGANGLELSAAIQGLENPPHIIVATGEGSASDWRTLSQMGVAAFLMKPVDLVAIVDTAAQFLRS